MKLFGFDITRGKGSDSEFSEPGPNAFTTKENVEGAVDVGGSIYGGRIAPISTDVNLSTESQLINTYRNMLMQAEVSTGVEEIVNEAISEDAAGDVVKLDLRKVGLSDAIKLKIEKEFSTILSLLNFDNEGYEIFSRWYVDGRLNYHPIFDPKKPKEGIQELRYIDPRKIRLVREVETKNVGGVDIPYVKEEYYVYSQQGFDVNTPFVVNNPVNALSGLKIRKDNIVRVTSGLLSEDQAMALSYLHKAIKPLNQLRYLEDAAVIYRLTRAPERRVFYIDVGKLPAAKAEQQLHETMRRHKNNLVYNQNTGEIGDQKKFMTMTEDFWFSRREGSRGTEVSSIPGGQNLDQVEDILYFQKKLFRALNVPFTRLDDQTSFQFGRPSELNRHEAKFGKFVKRLRMRFSTLFDEILGIQLILKGIVTPDEWNSIKNDIRYQFSSDSFSSELKDIEITRERINMAKDMFDMVGTYYSVDDIRRNILRQNDSDIERITQQIKKEKKDGTIENMDSVEE